MMMMMMVMLVGEEDGKRWTLSYILLQ